MEGAFASSQKIRTVFFRTNSVRNIILGGKTQPSSSTEALSRKVECSSRGQLVELILLTASAKRRKDAMLPLTESFAVDRRGATGTLFGVGRALM